MSRSKYYLSFLLILFVTISPNIGQAKQFYSLSATEAILVDDTTGRVLYEKKAKEKRPIASITKIMTAIIAIEFGDLQDKVTISKEAANISGSSIYLEEFEQMSVEDLLYGLMLRSGNDAAVALAEHIGGSVEGFTYLMNEKAAYLGMNDTSFKNPHGLDETDHYSTAFDMALLMRYAIKNEIFKQISETTTYKSDNRTYAWANKNKLLTSLYPYSTGGKTGYTKKAGRTLVSTAEKKGHQLIAVTLNANDDWNDHIYLYETHFATMKPFLLEEKGARTFPIDSDLTVRQKLKQPIIIYLFPHEVERLTKEITIDLRDNRFLGFITYKLDDEVLVHFPIEEKKQKNRFLQIKEKVVQFLGVDHDR